MKINITAEHEGVTKTICVWEMEPMEPGEVTTNKDVTDEVFDAIKSEISFFMKGQPWFRQGKE